MIEVITRQSVLSVNTFFAANLESGSSSWVNSEQFRQRHGSQSLILGCESKPARTPSQDQCFSHLTLGVTATMLPPEYSWTGRR